MSITNHPNEQNMSAACARDDTSATDCRSGSVGTCNRASSTYDHSFASARAVLPDTTVPAGIQPAPAAPAPALEAAVPGQDC